MSELKPRIHGEANGLDYVLVGDYYIPTIELPEEEAHPIGKWGRMYRAYLEETNSLLLNYLTLTGRLHTCLADLDEQAKERSRVLIRQLAATEGVTEDLKRQSQWEWVKAINRIVSRMEEIIMDEIVNT